MIFLFDLDDTLIDTSIYAKMYPSIVSEVKSRGHDIDSLDLKKNKYGNYDSGDVCKKLDMLDFYYSILEKEISVNNVLFSEVKEVFSSLEGKKGIVSNSMLRTIKLYLDKYDLKVDFIFSSDNAGCNKDSVEYWKKLIAAENLDPSECLVIGDDYEEDVEVPSSLGFKTFYLDNRDKWKDLLSNYTKI
jgi:HAD superfamily hydrolase (TIGR01549 family)